MTLTELVSSVCVNGSVTVAQPDKKDCLKWDRRADYETSDLSHCDIAWAANMEVKDIRALRDALYIEVAPKA